MAEWSKARDCNPRIRRGFESLSMLHRVSICQVTEAALNPARPARAGDRDLGALLLDSEPAKWSACLRTALVPLGMGIKTSALRSWSVNPSGDGERLESVSWADKAHGARDLNSPRKRLDIRYGMWYSKS